MDKISFLEYLFSNSTATIHSFNFCCILSNPEEGLFVKSILESCCEMVLAPPELLLPVTAPKIALSNERASMPE